MKRISRDMTPKEREARGWKVFSALILEPALELLTMSQRVGRYKGYERACRNMPIWVVPRIQPSSHDGDGGLFFRKL